MKIKFYTFISKKLIHCNKSNEIIFLMNFQFWFSFEHVYYNFIVSFEYIFDCYK